MTCSVSLTVLVNYRIGPHAGLWRRSSLKRYLQAGESAFELSGTRRARHITDRFYCQSLEIFNDQGRLVFPYIPTGTVKRQWYRPAVEELFAKHEIEIDFSKRGFYNPTRLQRALQAQRSALRRLFMQWMP